MALGVSVTLGACSGGSSSSEPEDLDDPIATVSVTTGCQGGEIVIVFVNPAVTGPRVEEIRGALQGLPGVAALVYVDQQQAYVEFQELYKDEPEKLEAVTPEVLPSSFRLTLAADGRADDIEAAATRLDGVGEVIC
jgi:cell division protein FtsX